MLIVVNHQVVSISLRIVLTILVLKDFTENKQQDQLRYELNCVGENFLWNYLVLNIVWVYWSIATLNFKGYNAAEYCKLSDKVQSVAAD